MWNDLYLNATIASLAETNVPYGLIENGAIGVEAGRIKWVGPQTALPGSPTQLAQTTTDFNGALITPGLIDCHTHLIYGGNRIDEFERRLNGASYEEIAAAGGGIISTVNATRSLSDRQLANHATARLKALMAEGVTTIEIKSGYGLTIEAELTMLRAARILEAENDISIATTFLGAHAVPPEFKGRADDYIDHICNDMLPAAHAEGLVDAVDGFCENIAFSRDQIKRVFEKARELGIPVKLHAEQLSDQKGAMLAADYKALSVDHLEYLDPDDAAHIVNAGTIPVLLPGAFHMLGETQRPPIDALRAQGANFAVATDCNPGSSPLTSLLLAMNMACVTFGLTPQEALRGTTINAAKALGRDHEVGSIEVGKKADFAIWDTNNPAALSYYLGYNLLKQRIFSGLK